MRQTIIFILTIIFFSCQNDLDKNKQVFQNILGEKKTNAINSLVTDFEKNLKKNYPELKIEKAYEKYLTEIISDSTTDFEKFKFQSPKTETKLNKSGLWNELYLKDENGLLMINKTGQYLRALDYVGETDKFVKEYYENREAAGMIRQELIVRGILKSNPNFNDYFHKRIVVIEFTF
ncbi:hypothetical protein [Lutibacter oricola]|nr:hypothetical protein [Lutibacter oricola]